MKLRVVSPRETIIKYVMIELFAIPFFLLVLRNLTPFRYFSVMQTLQYALLAAVALFILLPVFVELFGFGSARFIISSRGVIYQTRRTKYKLAWEDVDRVVLSPDLYGQVTKRSYVVFYAEEASNLVRNRSEFHARAFGAQYRKGLEKTIATYCDLEIENLREIKH
jgi:hypothetical protein